MLPVPIYKEQFVPLIGAVEPVIPAEVVEPVEAVGSCESTALHKSARTKSALEYLNTISRITIYNCVQSMTSLACM